MSNLLKYKDYRGQVEYSDEDSTFYGRILGINDLVSFEGSTVEELKKSFIESVDDYIETCKELGKNPEKEYKGQFNVRVPAKLHRSAVRTAANKHMSLNKFIETVLKNALRNE